MITAVGELEQQVLQQSARAQNTPAKPDGRAVCRCESTRARPAAAQMVKVMGRYRYHLTIRAKDCARWRRLISGVLRGVYAGR